MGMHRDVNRKRPAHIKKNHKRHRELVKRRRASRPPGRVAEIPDLDIMPPGQLLKLRTNPNANIELSGKKKRKILKRLRREAKEDARMDTTPAAATTVSTTKSSSSTAGVLAAPAKRRTKAAAAAMEIDK